MRSVIEAHAEHPHCQDYRNRIYNRSKDTVFKEGGNHWSEIEKNMDKRVPMGFVSLSQFRMLSRRLASPVVQLALGKRLCVKK